MSFSSEVKEELTGVCVQARHCQIAEMAAIISFCGRIRINLSDYYSMQVRTENVFVARKFFTLLKKTFKIDTEIGLRRYPGTGKANTYVLALPGHEDTIRVLQAVKLLGPDLEIKEELSLTHNVLVSSQCCRRAYLRGAFLAAGSISNPNRSYHFEIVCATKNKAAQLAELIQTFDIDAKTIRRKNHFVVYVKEGEALVALLGLMGAGISLMKFENIRILKDMRNTVNRKVNCETANINKTVNAAVKQVEDITYIRDTIGFSNLSENLKEIAALRIAYPDATLRELGALLTPTVGKSGVNHRLRKLSDIANEVRSSKEEIYYDQKTGDN